jgi:hypothetical protein
MMFDCDLFAEVDVDLADGQGPSMLTALNDTPSMLPPTSAYAFSLYLPRFSFARAEEGLHVVCRLP